MYDAMHNIMYNAMHNVKKLSSKIQKRREDLRVEMDVHDVIEKRLDIM
jgi:hypothetical protein